MDSNLGSAAVAASRPDPRAASGNFPMTEHQGIPEAHSAGCAHLAVSANLHSIARCTRSRELCSAELLLDMRLVGLDGLHAQVQLVGDLPGPVPLADEPEDLQLPVAQPRDRRLRPARAVPSAICRSIALGDPVAHVHLAAQDPAERHQDVLGRLLLHDVAVGARPGAPARRRSTRRAWRAPGPAATGSVARMVLSSSIPSGPGSEMSSSRTSGRAAAIAARADSASSASPQTSRSGSWSISRASPWRTIGWSSTTKHPVLRAGGCAAGSAGHDRDSFQLSQRKPAADHGPAGASRRRTSSEPPTMLAR